MKTTPTAGPPKAKKTLVEPSNFSLQLLKESCNQDLNSADFLGLVQNNKRFCANLLKYINTLSDAPPLPVSAVGEAVKLLGRETVANLSLFWSLLAQYRHGRCPQFDYHRFWQGSIAVGSAARVLAAHQKIDPDRLFSYGVLTRIGELTLATAFPIEYGNLLCQGLARDKKAEKEKQLFRFSAGDLSWKLLARWQLRRECFELIRQCGMDRQGTKGNSVSLKELEILKLAIHMARICLLELPLSETFLAAEKEAETLGIHVDHFGQFFDSFISSWQQSSEFFKIPTLHCPNYHQIKTIDDAAIEIRDHNKPPPLTFLAADDDPMTLIYLKKMLASDGRTLLTSDNGEKALELALKHRPHILITDWRMPGLNGIELCRILRKTNITQHIYIIMLTCNETDDELVQAFEAGADDYVVKPFTPKVLQARISSGERLILSQQTIRRDREIIQRYAARLSTANRKLQNMAMTDFLTGLPNRRNALLRLRNLVAEVKRYGEPLSCLLIDIDHFKTINDTYGHDCGDGVLQQLSKLLEEKARSYDIVSRWGGEEFLIICARSGPHDAFQLAERLRKNVEQFKISLAKETLIKVTISIGVATWSSELRNEDELIKVADTNLYQAKENGRNRVEASSRRTIPPLSH